MQADVRVEATDEGDFAGSSAPAGDRRFRCEARSRAVAGGGGTAAKPGAKAAAAVARPPAATPGAAPPAAAPADAAETAVLFAFELEVHCAAEWAGTAAANASVQVRVLFCWSAHVFCVWEQQRVAT